MIRISQFLGLELLYTAQRKTLVLHLVPMLCPTPRLSLPANTATILKTPSSNIRLHLVNNFSRFYIQNLYIKINGSKSFVLGFHSIPILVHLLCVFEQLIQLIKLRNFINFFSNKKCFNCIPNHQDFLYLEMWSKIYAGSIHFLVCTLLFLILKKLPNLTFKKNLEHYLVHEKEDNNVRKQSITSFASFPSQ